MKKRYKRNFTNQKTLRIIVFFLSVISLFLINLLSVQAASISQYSYSVGETIIIHPAPGTNELSLKFANQTFKYLGAPDNSIAYTPKIPGEYIIEELFNDGRILETKFYVAKSDLNWNGVGKGNDSAQEINNTEIIINNTNNTNTNTNNNLNNNTNNNIKNNTPLINSTNVIFNTTIKLIQDDNSPVDSGNAPLLQQGDSNLLMITPQLDNIISLKTGTLVTKIVNEMDSRQANKRIKLVSPRNTVWKGNFIVRDKGTTYRGNLADLGANPPLSAGTEIEITPEVDSIKNIVMRNVDMRKDIQIGIDEPVYTTIDSPRENRTWVNAFAIDPTNVSFTDATVYATAVGTELYKCKDWSFNTSTCDGVWIKVMDIVPGQDYTITITPNDPGFAEAVITTGTTNLGDISNISISASIVSPFESWPTATSIIVNNPTNQSINVSAVKFSSPTAIFGVVTGVMPATGWSRTTTIVNWSGSMIIPPYSSEDFIVNITGSNTNNVNAIVSINATTNITNLTRTGYVTHTILTTAIQSSSLTFLNSSGMPVCYLPNVLQNTSTAYTVSVNNYPGDAAVQLNTLFLIHVPQGWENLSANAQTGWSVGTANGDPGSGMFLNAKVATTTIASGAARNFTFSATPPDEDGTSLYQPYIRLIGPSASTTRDIYTVFEPTLQSVNITSLLNYDDGLYAETRTYGGSQLVDHYISIPTPAESTANQWGLVVVNPTNNPINVTQIDWGANQNIFNTVAAITPAATWSVQSASALRWNGTVTIPARSAAEFRANVGLLGNANLIASISVTTTTTNRTIVSSEFTTMMLNRNTQYPSIMGVNRTGSQTYLMDNISAATRYNFTIRINNTGGLVTVPIGTKLEITIPPGWFNITAATQTGWTIYDITQNSNRGGGLIRAITATTTIANGGTRNFLFNATAPNVGSNSTYRIDVRLLGPSASNVAYSIQSLAQIAARVVPAPATYGLSVTHLSESIGNSSNVSSIIITSIAKSTWPTSYNLSIYNTQTAIYDTISTLTLNNTPINTTILLVANRTFNPQKYVNQTLGTTNYGKVLVGWFTTTGNTTSLLEDLLIINITQDIQPPFVVLHAPENDSYLNISLQSLQYNASDDTDLMNCSLYINGILNSTNNSITNASTNAFVINFSNGRYNWSVGCYDLVSKTNRTDNQSFVIDTILPIVGLTSPTAVSNWSVNSLIFTYTPQDTNLANCSILLDGIINQTNTTPLSGLQNNFSILNIPDGLHYWNISCIDLAQNMNSSVTWNFTIDVTAPIWNSPNAAPDSNVVYDPANTHDFDMNWTDGNGISTVIFMENFTGNWVNHTTTQNGDIYAYATSAIGVGSYAWRMYANDSYNNLNMSDLQTYVVQKATPEIMLLLNDTIDNYPIDINESVNITALMITPATGYLEIYLNGTLIASGNNAVQNISTFNTSGKKNVTVVYPSTQNYTGTSTTLFIVIGDKTGPAINQTSPDNGGFRGMVNTTFTFNASDDTGIDNCTLLIRNNISDTTSWWSINWSARQKIIIQEQSGANLSNYSVQLLLNSTNFNFDIAKRNGSDIRVLLINNSGTQQQIPLWIEWWNQTTKNASVWIQLPYLNASGNKTVYLYYSSPSAKSVSDGNTTFLIFGEFSVNRIGTYWQSADNDLVAGTSFNILNNVLNITAGGVDTWTVNDEYGSIFRSISGDFIAEIKVLSQQNTNAWAKAGIMVRNNMSARASSLGYAYATVTPGHGYSFETDVVSQNGFLDTNVTSGATSYPSMLRLFKVGNIFGMQYSTNNGSTWTSISPNQTLSTANYTQDVGLSVTSRAGATLSRVIFDDFIVRRYSSIAPTITYGRVDAFFENNTNLGPYTVPFEGTFDVRGLFEANMSSKIYCYDPIGNIGYSKITNFTVDFTSPSSVTLLTPTNNSINRNQSPQFTWTQTTEPYFANYTLILDTAADFSSPNYAIAITPITNTTLLFNETLLPNVAWYWKIRSYDFAGNYNDSLSFIYRIDISPPEITLQSPQNNTYYNITAINITYLINDFSIVANCTLSLNDSTTYVNSSLNQTNQNIFTITKSAADCLYNITCTDITNNFNTTENVLFHIDTSAPTQVSLLTPINNTFTNNNTPTLTWSQTVENHFANYTVLVSDNSTFPYTNYTYTIYDLSTTNYVVITPWSDGIWYWKIIVWDLAGNSVDPGFVYTLDSTPPNAFDLLSPVNGTSDVSSTPNLVWYPSDDLYFTNYTVLVSDTNTFSHNNYTYATYNATNTSYQVSTPWTTNTIWYWKVLAYDNATNVQNSSSTFMYIADTDNPVVKLVAPPNSTSYASNSSLIPFTFNVTDLSDISSCTLYVNGSVDSFASDMFFIDKNVNQTFITALSSDNYNWSVSCIDAAGNTGYSAVWNISINVTLPKQRWYDTALENTPQTNASQNWSAMIVYGNATAAAIVNTVPKYRIWDGNAWSAESSLPDSGSPLRWVKMASSPILSRASEKIAVTLSNDGWLDAYVWNGSAWTAYNNIASVGTTNNAYGSFDIEYENQRGRAMLLYAVNSTNSAEDLAYRIWNGSGWQPQVGVNDPLNTTDISVGYIKLVKNPDSSSNELASAYIDVTDADARAMIWNGSAWQSFINITSAISIATEEDIGIAYEQQSKKILAVAGTGSTVAFAFYNRTSWNRTGTTDINPSAAVVTNWLTLKPNPVGNEIMIGGLDAGSDFSTALWSNGVWSGALRHDATSDGNTRRMADFEWESTGNNGIVMWGTTSGQVDYKTYNVGTGWGAQNNVVTSASTHAWIWLVKNPNNATGDVKILGGIEDAAALLEGVRWVGSTPPVRQANAFTTNQGSVTYRIFDIAYDNYAPRTTSYNNYSLNMSIDSTPNVVSIISSTTSGGLTLLNNATSYPMRNYSALGLLIPRGGIVRFSALLSSMNQNVSYITWSIFGVNSTSEVLICTKGNYTRNSSLAVPIDKNGINIYTGICSPQNNTIITPEKSLRVYMYINSSVENTITKFIDNLSTYVEIDGYMLGNLSVNIVAPTIDPYIGEGENLTFTCQVNCTNGYCLKVEVLGQINNSTAVYSPINYFTENIILNQTAVNPVLLGTINNTMNATIELLGNIYSFNNTLLCNVSSDYINATSAIENITVLDKVPPNIILVDLINGGAYDPGLFTFIYNASDRRLGACSLWGNWSGSWTLNQTMIPNNYTLSSFPQINISQYGSFIWNVNCSDLAGNNGMAPANYTFYVAGDVSVTANDIFFSPTSPTEGSNVTIYAIITNNANRNETNVNVAFYVGDPQLGAPQLGGNVTISLLEAKSNVTVNNSVIVALGNLSIYVVVDPAYGGGNIIESNETNNIANNTLQVSIWQSFFGNTSGNTTLGTSSNASFISWSAASISGNIYVACTGTTNGISFLALRPLGKNSTNGVNVNTLNDFSELDAVINTTQYLDNINNTYTSSGVPIAMQNFNVYGNTYSLPVANSSSDGNFTTGIMWDSDDSINSYYDAADKEDVVFVTKIKQNTTTIYGAVDYITKFPSPLKGMKGGANTVTIYYEIN